MATVCDSLDALIDSARGSPLDEDSDDEDLPLNEHQAKLCENLIQSLSTYHLEEQKATTSCDSSSEDSRDETEKSATISNNFIHTNIDYNNKRKEKPARKGGAKFQDTTVREVFVDANAGLSRVPPLLASLMMTRVEIEKLLPPTQDEEANEEVMNTSSAIMLTRPALIAAQLYSTLLTIPGALGSGLIEMEAVSSLTALFRRWRVECVTAIDLIVAEKPSKKQKKPSKRKTGKRKSSKRTTTNPIKRRSGRKRRTVVFADDASTDEEEEDDWESQSEDEINNKKEGILVVEEDDNGIISPSLLLLLGLKAAFALSEVPMQKEFMSWSSEAREAILDAVTSLYGTVCALVTPPVRSKLDGQIVKLQESVVNRATTCLTKCITLTTEVAGDDDDDAFGGTESISKKRHETSVFLFRGLHPVMAMREHLPNGEAGKSLSCEKAAEVLQGFVQFVTENIAQDNNNLWTPKPTSARGKRSTVRRSTKSAGEDVTATPKTTSKGRKKRVSFGVVMESNSKTPMLKSAKKTSRTAVTPSNGPAFGGTQPRPVLRAVLGLMQKLATSKGLDRANLRSSTVNSLRGCLRHLPTLERTCMLRFINQLTRSKVSVHRLTGAEIVGGILTETWLWENHANQPMTTPEAQPRNQIPATPSSNMRSGSISSAKSLDAESPLDALTPRPENQDLEIPPSLLAALIGRLVDRAPAVRARAAGSLADLLRKLSAAELCKENVDPLLELRKALGLKGYSVVSILRKRASSDEKATVRKTSIEALTELMLLGTVDVRFPVGISEEEVVVLGQICSDRSLVTRKAAAQALTTLLDRCTALSDRDASNNIDLVARTWCFSVLPMTLDAEAGCVVKAVELVHEVVIMPILLYDDETFDERAYTTAWRILSLVCESSRSGSAKNMTNALKASITKLTAPDSVYEDIAKTLLKRICEVAIRTLDGPAEELFQSELESQRSGVWCLFDALVDQTKNLSALYKTLKKLRIDLDFLGTSWEKMLTLLTTPDIPKTSANLLRACMKSCLRLLSRMASCVHNDVAHQSATNLHSMLQQFTMPPDLIGSAVAALAATSIVCSGEADMDQVRNDCSKRMTSLYATCEETISSYAKQILDGEHPASEAVEEANVRAIFMVGELAIVGFTPDENDTHKGKGSSHHATDVDPLKGLNIPPSKKLIDLVMTFMAFLPGENQTPETARAHAFTCVGKICMRSGQTALAKKCVIIFAREIHENFNDGCPSVQSNALLVLGDLCCRYTNLVDRYLPVMATCLQSGLDADNSIIVTAREDKSVVVRKNAILLLSSLLLQDYIKFRGLLFFRFLCCSADNDEVVAQIGESMLVGPLLSKNPKLFFNNFVESLFVLNRCMHPIYKAAKSFGDGGGGIAVDFEGINLTGLAGRAKRFHMYELMLTRMSDEEKIGVTARLAKDILGSAASSCGGNLHKVCTNPMTKADVDRAADRDYESAFNVLSDVFAILSSPLLRVGKKSQSNDDDQDIIEDPNNPNPTRRVIAAKGKLLSRISRKHLIEIMIPILCNLKSVLQKSCSPLLRELMDYFVNIFRSYKDEVKDVLSNDPNLLQEIEYDARRMSKAGPKTPGRKTPGGKGRTPKKAAPASSSEDADLPKQE